MGSNREASPHQINQDFSQTEELQCCEEGQLQPALAAAACPGAPRGFFTPHLPEPRDRQLIPVPVVLSPGALISGQGAK